MEASRVAPLNRPLEVLIAEDDALLADYLALEIGELGCVVEVAANGQEALALLDRCPFDVLVTDWMMPEIDGIDLVKRLRSKKRDLYLHIIMMTARGEERTIRTALEAGADAFLYKPLGRLEIELEIASAKRIVALQRRLQRRNRHLSAANERTRVAYRRIKDDLRSAGALQQRLLPAPRLSGPLRYGWLFRPSLDIGGDSIGVLPVGNGRLLFFVIDVAGHGIPAALNSFSLHNRLTRLAPADPQSLIQAAVELNDEVLSQAGEGYFTSVFGLVDPASWQMWIVRAGHPPPLLCPGGGQSLYLEAGGLPLGLLPGASFDLCELELDPGDRLLVYTDGITECAGGGCFGEPELAHFLEAQRTAPLEDALKRLDARLFDLREGRPPEDDISALLLERSI